MSEIAHQDHIEEKSIFSKSSSLKDVRFFAERYLKNFIFKKI